MKVKVIAIEFEIPEPCEEATLDDIILDEDDVCEEYINSPIWVEMLNKRMSEIC